MTYPIFFVVLIIGVASCDEPGVEGRQPVAEVFAGARDIFNIMGSRVNVIQEYPLLVHQTKKKE